MPKHISIKFILNPNLQDWIPNPTRIPPQPQSPRSTTCFKRVLGAPNGKSNTRNRPFLRSPICEDYVMLFSLTMKQSIFFLYKFYYGGKSKCYLRIQTTLKLKIRKKILQWEGGFCCMQYCKILPFLKFSFLLNCEIMTKHEKNGVVKKWHYLRIQCNERFYSEIRKE